MYVKGIRVELNLIFEASNEFSIKFKKEREEWRFWYKKIEEDSSNVGEPKKRWFEEAKEYLITLGARE